MKRRYRHLTHSMKNMKSDRRKKNKYQFEDENDVKPVSRFQTSWTPLRAQSCPASPPNEGKMLVPPEKFRDSWSDT